MERLSARLVYHDHPVPLANIKAVNHGNINAEQVWEARLADGFSFQHFTFNVGSLWTGTGAMVSRHTPFGMKMVRYLPPSRLGLL